jgi:hypothetical protein
MQFIIIYYTLDFFNPPTINEITSSVTLSLIGLSAALMKEGESEVFLSKTKCQQIRNFLELKFNIHYLFLMYPIFRCPWNHSTDFH